RPGRGGRGRAGDRAARADADAGFARGGVHGADARRRRVQGRRRRGRTRASGRGGMSTEAASVVAIPRLADAGKVTQIRVALSEWTKLASLRSSRWSLLVAVVFTIGLPLLFATVTATHWAHMSPHERADRHPLDIALAGVNLSQLAIAVLGVLIITGE